MTCRLCGLRRARRACPALGYDICAVCCGTKRLVEIQCPSDCGYLASAREHPPATAVRRHQRDLETVIQFVRDFNQRQTRLFFLISTFLTRYQPPELQTLLDEDVAEATGALAATFETAAKGVIYEHHAASAAGARLAAALSPALLEAGQGLGTPFERDAAVVLRRIEGAAREVRRAAPGHTRAFIELLGRVIRKTDDAGANEPGAPGTEDDGPRLIVP